MNKIVEIAEAVKKVGGDMYFVGGYVRDKIIGIENKDIDVEIYNITPNKLREVLSQFGDVEEIGSSFGVLMIKGLDIDFAMPRTESKTGEGHRGFNVQVNPFLPTKEASRRRDYTINSIMENVLSGEIIDHWGGVEDLKKGIIRHIDPITFVEDPLRLYRGAQFASRFGFEVARETLELMASVSVDFLPKERVFEEFKKALLKSDKPSIAFNILKNVGVISEHRFSQLYRLIGTNQNPDYHPEGDVWNHTMLVIDQATKFRDRVSNPIGFMLSALLHDIGKPYVTVLENGKIRSNGHDSVGAEEVDFILDEITANKELRAYIKSMIKWHMAPHFYYPVASDKALRKLSMNVHIEDLLLLSQADHLGREGIVFDEELKIKEAWFRGKLQALSLEKKIKPIILGRDLVQMGYKPGKGFKNVLEQAFELQLEGFNKKEILEQLDMEGLETC